MNQDVAQEYEKASLCPEARVMGRDRLTLTGPFSILFFLFSIIGLLFPANCGNLPSSRIAKESRLDIRKEIADVDQERFIVTDEDKKRIDDWIKENNLNRYGDPKGTMYTGGTPLFDERTGKRIDRYQYILKKHPELWLSR